MNWRDWKVWVATLTWERKWFVLLVLFRPIIDVFYGLQKISPFLSPLVIVGGLTPIAIVISFFSGRMPKYRRVFQDHCMLCIALLTSINLIFISIHGLGYGLVHSGLKMLIAPVIYFYLRRFVKSELDVIGIATTFLYSTIFPLVMLLYERFVGQIGSGQMARGMVRFEGLYADVLSYSTYINFALLCTGFLFLLSVECGGRKKRNLMQFVAVFAICFAAMLSLNHIASWAVFAALVILNMGFFLNPKSLLAGVVIILVAFGGLFLMKDTLDERFDMLTETERRALSGEIDRERAMHGRGSIWARYHKRWEQSSIFAKLFGAGCSISSRPFEEISDSRAALNMMSGGMHSDYVRLFYGTGITGLIAYLLFMISSIWSFFRADRVFRYLILGVGGSITLYSVSTNPLLYASANYFPVAVFVYSALLHERRKYGHRSPY